MSHGYLPSTPSTLDFLVHTNLDDSTTANNEYTATTHRSWNSSGLTFILLILGTVASEWRTIHAISSLASDRAMSSTSALYGKKKHADDIKYSTENQYRILHTATDAGFHPLISSAENHLHLIQ